MKKAKLFTLLFTLFLIAGNFYTAEAQLLPTKLKITIIDDLGNVVEGATVTIYGTKEDYLNSENPIMNEKTDKKGIVKFKGLDAVSYFVDARTEEKSNDGGGAKIAPLDEGRVNTINIVIE